MRVTLGRVQFVIARAIGGAVPSASVQVTASDVPGQIAVEWFRGGQLVKQFHASSVTDALLAAATMFEEAEQESLPGGRVVPMHAQRREHPGKVRVPGHCMVGRVPGADGGHVPRCRCGWVGGVYGRQVEAQYAYRRHLLDVREQRSVPA